MEAMKKLNDLIKNTDPAKKHEDLIKSLPSFGGNRKGYQSSGNISAKNYGIRGGINKGSQSAHASKLLPKGSDFMRKNSLYDSLQPSEHERRSGSQVAGTSARKQKLMISEYGTAEPMDAQRNGDVASKEHSSQHGAKTKGQKYLEMAERGM